MTDAYDAMVAPRPYRTQLSPADATAELLRRAGTQFDPDVVDAFCAINPDGDPLAAEVVEGYRSGGFGEVAAMPESEVAVLEPVRTASKG